MTLPTPISLRSWFDASVEDFLCIAPTSTSPQPAHVLNGFFHFALTGRRSVRTAVDLVATRSGLWARSASDVRERSTITLPAEEQALDRLRHALAGVIAADRAVYASAASFQIAHLGLVTSDGTHFRLGQLGARLALASDEGAQLLRRVVDRLNRPQPNAIWALEAVLSEVDVARSVEVQPADRLPWSASPSCALLHEELAAVVQRGLVLASEGEDSLLGLRILATTLTWAGLVAFAQVPALELGGNLNPLLCEVGPPGQLRGLRAASAASLTALLGSFDEWLATRLLSEVRERFGNDEPSDEDAKEFLMTSKPYSLSGGSRRTQAQLGAVYDVWRRDRPVFDAIAQTLRDSLSASMGNKPAKWFAAVGRHCGFVGPRGGHSPRLRVEVALAPTLVTAGLHEDDGETIPYRLWLDRLADRFGIVVGPSHTSRQMSLRAPEEDLDANRQRLAELLAALGLARRFSDGVTEVLNPLVLWKAQ